MAIRSVADIQGQAERARTMIVEGMQMLQRLGREIETKRLNAAASVAPEVDPDLVRKT